MLIEFCVFFFMERKNANEDHAKNAVIAPSGKQCTWYMYLFIVKKPNTKLNKAPKSCKTRSKVKLGVPKQNHMTAALIRQMTT